MAWRVPSHLHPPPLYATKQHNKRESSNLNGAPITEWVALIAGHRAFLVEMTLSPTRLSVGDFWITMPNFIDDYYQAGPSVQSQSGLTPTPGR
jgi:hypothetical protein